MTFIEKTELLINQRGAIKAMLVEGNKLKVGHLPVEAEHFFKSLNPFITPAYAIIWFASGSYAVWDRYGGYWDFIVVPGIPDYLKK